MQCARHPKVETALSCARCATPICPDCMVAGAVGMICKTCAAIGKSPLYQVRPERLALALVAGLIAGTLTGVVLQHIGGFLYVTLLLSPVIGGLLGTIVLWATGHKRGPKVEFATGFSVLGGAALSLLIDGGYLMLFASPMSAILFLVSVALVCAAAIGKIRYL